MTTISIPGFIVVVPAESWREGLANVIDGMHYSHQIWEPVSGQSLVCTHTLQFDIPEGFDPRPQQIVALKSQREKLCEEFAEAAMKIDIGISKLSALTYTPSEAQAA